jgi:hypothetical protein
MWDSIEEFAKWYEESGYPICPPQHNAIFRTNNASALVLFREGQFQVELYIGDADSVTPEHSHPGVESIIVYLSGEGRTSINSITEKYREPAEYDKVNPDGTSVLFKLAMRINPQDTHGLVTGSKGFAFYSIEKWDDSLTPTSVTIEWEGETTGDLHDETLLKFKH